MTTQEDFVRQMAARIRVSYPDSALIVALDVVKEIAAAVRQPVTRRASEKTNDQRVVDIETVVCELFCCSRNELSSRARTGNLPLARWCFWRALRTRMRMTYTQIADVVGRDRSAVVSGAEQVDLHAQQWLTLQHRLDAMWHESELDAAE